MIVGDKHASSSAVAGATSYPIFSFLNVPAKKANGMARPYLVMECIDSPISYEGQQITLPSEEHNSIADEYDHGRFRDAYDQDRP